MEDRAGRVPHHLSGGEKKRVQLPYYRMEATVPCPRRPLQADPRVLRSGRVYQLAFEKIGKTVIFSKSRRLAHSLDCRLIYEMNKGPSMHREQRRDFFRPNFSARRLDVPLCRTESGACVSTASIQHGIYIHGCIRIFKAFKRTMSEELFLIEKQAYRRVYSISRWPG